MKNALLALVVIDLLLIFGAGIRMMSAPIKEVKRYSAPADGGARDTAAPAGGGTWSQPPEQASGAAPSGPTLGGALAPASGADVPPGMEGVMGGNRPTFEVDDPNAAIDAQAAGVDDAKDKLRNLPGGGG